MRPSLASCLPKATLANLKIACRKPQTLLKLLGSNTTYLVYESAANIVNIAKHGISTDSDLQRPFHVAVSLLSLVGGGGAERRGFCVFAFAPLL